MMIKSDSLLVTEVAITAPPTSCWGCVKQPKSTTFSGKQNCPRVRTCIYLIIYLFFFSFKLKVRIEGYAEVRTDEECLASFRNLPKEIQVAFCFGHQSSVVKNRQVIIHHLRNLHLYFPPTISLMNPNKTLLI